MMRRTVHILAGLMAVIATAGVRASGPEGVPGGGGAENGALARTLQGPGDGSGRVRGNAPASPAPYSGVQGREGIPDRMEPLPPEAVGVRVEEHFGAALPLDAVFTDESGKRVTLGSMFASGKPVVMQLGYFGCPKLCDVISQKTVDALAEVPLGLGRDYQVIFVSIDPKEKQDLAREKKGSYLRRYTDGGKHELVDAERGWQFLTGEQDQITRLATAVGFDYRFNEQTQQYVHPAVLILCTPSGTVSRYLYGAGFDPGLLKMSIVDAAQGKGGSVMDQIVLLCLHIDPNTGQYSVQAMRIMRVGGVLTVAAILTVVSVFSLVGRRRRGLAGPRRGVFAVAGGGMGGVVGDGN